MDRLLAWDGNRERLYGATSDCARTLGIEETIKFILNTERKCIYFVFEGVVSGQGDDWFFSGCAAGGS